MVPGLSVVGKKVSTQDIANATKCQSFYNWMTDQESTTAIFLLVMVLSKPPRLTVITCPNQKHCGQATLK